MAWAGPGVCVCRTQPRQEADRERAWTQEDDLYREGMLRPHHLKANTPRPGPC